MRMLHYCKRESFLFFTEQPGSALNLRYILDWAWNKVVQTKEELDGICMS